MIQPPILRAARWLVAAFFLIHSMMVLAEDCTDWMARLNEKLTLSELTIPGTHNSCALHEPLRGTARCQSLTLWEQLTAGVRFLDIRCRHVDDSFRIYHGLIDQRLSFTDVMETCTEFLLKHPGEMVIMSLKEESDAIRVTRSFETTFTSLAKPYDKFWLQSSERTPSLAQARGKILLLRRFDAKQCEWGMDASRWPVNSTFSQPKQNPRLKVQDCFIVEDPKAKWAAAQAFFEKVPAADSKILHINYLSGYKPGFAGIPDVPAVSTVVNSSLSSWLATAPRGRYGIAVMDFADQKMCELLIRTNRS